jgi:hypothetical protein
MGGRGEKRQRTGQGEGDIGRDAKAGRTGEEKTEGFALGTRLDCGSGAQPASQPASQPATCGRIIGAVQQRKSRAFRPHPSPAEWVD